MTGADILEAESILADILEGDLGPCGSTDREEALAIAQVHATLALAAAQAINAYSPHGPASQALFDAVTE